MGYKEPSVYLAPHVDKIIINRIKNIISDHCSKAVYNFKVDEVDVDDKAFMGKGKIKFIPHKRLTKYLDSRKKKMEDKR